MEIPSILSLKFLVKDMIQIISEMLSSYNEVMLNILPPQEQCTERYTFHITFYSQTR